MDYSQFGAMLPELIILGLFFIVLIADVFTRDGAAKKWLTPMTAVLFGLATVGLSFFFSLCVVKPLRPDFLSLCSLFSFFFKFTVWPNVLRL